MQNRNNTIEERLQIINDYIQRTMDALNATRQVVQGLSTQTNFSQSSVQQGPVSGLSHTSFVPQLVQTPYGIVAINAQVPQVQGNVGFTGVPQVQLGYGLQHTSFVPQLQGWPMNVAQMGIPQVGIPQVGVGYNYGWPTGLNHTTFVQSPVSPWGVPVVQQWPVNQGYGFNPQTGFGGQQVVQQGVPTQTF